MVARPKYGTMLTALITIGALTAIGFVFVQQASPYVNVAQAKTTSGTDLHLAGKVIESSLQESSPRTINFTIEDTAGHQMPVIYKGEAIQNVADAKQVVAIGGCENGVFYAHQLLVKCPSKYDDNAGAASLLKKSPNTY